MDQSKKTSMDQSKRSMSLPTALRLCEISSLETHADSPQDDVCESPSPPEPEQKPTSEKTKPQRSVSCIQLMRKHKKITTSRELLESLKYEPHPNALPKRIRARYKL